MKYKLINIKTNEQHLCDKVTINGFDYYVEDGKIVKPIDFSKFQYQKPNNLFKGDSGLKQYGEVYEVIATSNPDLDIPKVVDKNLDIKVLAEEHSKALSNDDDAIIFGFIEGYNKSQETHPFSKNDMIDAIKHCLKNIDVDLMFSKQDFYQNVTIKNHLEIWEEQQGKLIFYE